MRKLACSETDRGATKASMVNAPSRGRVSLPVTAVSGELQLEAGGPGVHFNEPRRTIYTRFMRNTRDPLADVFDAPLLSGWLMGSRGVME